VRPRSSRRGPRHRLFSIERRKIREVGSFGPLPAGFEPSAEHRLGLAFGAYPGQRASSIRRERFELRLPDRDQGNGQLDLVSLQRERPADPHAGNSEQLASLLVYRDPSWRSDFQELQWIFGGNYAAHRTTRSVGGSRLIEMLAMIIAEDRRCWSSKPAHRRARERRVVVGTAATQL
jgi:hypothetical protein